MVRRVLHLVLVSAIAAPLAPAQAPATQPGPNAKTAPDSNKFGSNVLPVVEITGFLAVLSVYNRIVYRNDMQDGLRVYSATWATTWDHLRKQTYVHDQDPFNVNQFGHPYMGATMYGLARSSGHGFWTSLVHANIGSWIWKMAGETDPPSIDDILTTGQAGSLLGEAMYRMADLVLKAGNREVPHRANEYFAALISPSGGLNRRIFGKRFKARLPDTDPATFMELRLGANVGAIAKDYASPVTLLRRDATAEFLISYGLPGKPGYEYTRPLDYFDFQVSFLSTTKNFIGNVMLRGLLKGGKTTSSASSSGIWGLYGSFDYISPYLFRVSSTALSVGTTRQYSLAPGLTLQGSVLGGVGYGAAGSTTVIPATTTNEAIRDYHFGVTPQALVAMRVIGGDRVALDLGLREYYVSGVGSDNSQGSETIFRGNSTLTLRLFGSHSLGVRYVMSTRDAKYGKQPDANFREGTVTVSYSVLGASRFGAVKLQ